MSASHRKVVNFALNIETFTTCLIWDGRWSIVYCRIEETIPKTFTGLMLHFMMVLSTLFIIAEVQPLQKRNALGELISQ